jgi:chemotaxis protein histidine kinase CheA
VRDICLIFPAGAALRGAGLDWSIYKIFRGCPDLLCDWIKDHEDETMTAKAAQEMVTAHKKALEAAATRGEENEEDEEEETAPAEETKDEETSETDKENSEEETQPLAAKDEELSDGQAPGEDAAIEITEEEGEPEPETAEELEVRRNKEKQKAEADMLEKVQTLQELANEITAFAQHNDPTVPWSREADQTVKDVVAELNWFRKWAKERDAYRTGADVKRPKQKKPDVVAPLPNGGSEEHSHAYQH